MNIPSPNLSIRISLQNKLIFSLLSVVLVSGLGALLVGKMVINRNIVQQAYSEVAQKLEMVDNTYASRLYVKQRLIASLASHQEFRKAVVTADRSRIHESIRNIREPSFDILNVADARGRILVRTHNPDTWGDSVAGDTYVQTVLLEKRPVSGFDVMDEDSLLRENVVLARRARVQLDPSGESETRGMVLKVAIPIWHEEVFVGVIYGALLLNNETSILDRAKNLILGEEKVNDREVGSITVFLEGLRISTSVRNEKGQRALGTRVSSEVYSKVFVEGQTWRDRALVVGHWTIAAYKPVRDIRGRTIGILYAGLLEDKFTRIGQDTNNAFLLTIFVSGLLSLLLSTYLIHHFIRPINVLVGAARDIASGEPRKVSIETGDEMGYLGRAFNAMVDALAEKDRRLMEGVEKRIERTEKLAVLGRLSSGVAHEINNPLTGVLAFTDALLESLAGTEYEDDLQVIKNETLRCREIVRGMLDFARETRLERTQANLNRIIGEVLLIVRNHASFQSIALDLKLDPGLPEIPVDINQIKSVFSNLVVNAADAMPNGGRLTIITELSSAGEYARIRLIDNGIGISEENIGKVFDPFFTTKETGKGTGLGLSVTYGIIQRHNGFISIKSAPGEGTQIEILLPLQSGESSHA